MTQKPTYYHHSCVQLCIHLEDMLTKTFKDLWVCMFPYVSSTTAKFERYAPNYVLCTRFMYGTRNCSRTSPILKQSGYSNVNELSCCGISYFLKSGIYGHLHGLHPCLWETDFT